MLEDTMLEHRVLSLLPCSLPSQHMCLNADMYTEVYMCPCTCGPINQPTNMLVHAFSAGDVEDFAFLFNVHFSLFFLKRGDFHVSGISEISLAFIMHVKIFPALV